MLRRLEKRILVPLPNPEARRRMFELLLSDRCRPQVSFEHMAGVTDGYSGARAAAQATVCTADRRAAGC